jgi:hypothetical protein
MKTETKTAMIIGGIGSMFIICLLVWGIGSIKASKAAVAKMHSDTAKQETLRQWNADAPKRAREARRMELKQDERLAELKVERARIERQLKYEARKAAKEQAARAVAKASRKAESDISWLKSCAGAIAQTEVENRLKSPRSAKFPWGTPACEVTDNTYMVHSYVDAQNGFGALIRSNWVVIMEHVGGERFRIISVVIK